MPKDFRFGFSLHETRDLPRVQGWARRAEDMGFDVLHVPDHLPTTALTMGVKAPAPFPTMMAVAAATDTLHVGTFVLNAGFYKAALLARDAEALRDLSGGRLELGLGAGYVKEEFEAADLPFPSPGQRVAHMGHIVDYMHDNLCDVPILIAGNGDKLLTIAARRANIIGLTGGDPASEDGDPLAERIGFVRAAAPERFDDLELNISITACPLDASGMPDLRITKRFLPHLTDEQLLRTPGVLSGSTTDIADTIRGYRDTYGVTYITVQQPHAEAFAKVIAELR
jgi:probable F420-dependent oxidoreductase